MRDSNRSLAPSHRGRNLALLTVLVLVGLLLAAVAFADPHAVFYTDRGQEQVFYNVLAALNQADYVEPPGQPPIQSVVEIGDAIETGQIKDDQGNIIGQARPEPNERLALPRIRVRAVTSDDGDVFYRELAYRRALAEKVRVELSRFSCGLQFLVYGKQDCEEPNASSGGTGGVTP